MRSMPGLLAVQANQGTQPGQAERAPLNSIRGTQRKYSACPAGASAPLPDLAAPVSMLVQQHAYSS